METGIASGVRRIEAVTGARALEWIEQDEDRLLHVCNLIHAGRDELAAAERVAELREKGAWDA